MRFKNKVNSYIHRKTSCGDIKGLRKDNYLLFKGVRYATAERWGVPNIVESWNGEFDATRAGDSCYQYDSFFDTYEGFAQFYYNQTAEKITVNYSEDCLNLNIWTPEDAKNLPVLVFIHGGSFVSGGNTAAYSIGEEYCKRGIVFISINYRLNAFSGLYEAGQPSNLALRDQLAALEWIKKNITDYGGNPDKVTVVGESAGALSLQCLLYSPYAKGLFSGAIMMSGGGHLEDLNVPSEPIYAQKVANLMKEKYGVSKLSELRDVSVKDIYLAWSEANLTDIELTNHSVKPLIDGDIIPDSVAKLIEQDKLYDVPCIFGMSSEDMWPYILYNTAVKWADHRSKAGKQPIYGYYMDRQLPGDNAGAYHACDLWYMFGALDYSWRPFTEIDYRISENMIDYVSYFVKTGSPNNGKFSHWEPLTHENTKFMRFGDQKASMYQPPVEKLKNAIQNNQPFPEV